MSKTIEELGYELHSEEEWQQAKRLFAAMGTSEKGAYFLYAIGMILVHQQDTQPEGMEIKVNGISMQVTLNPAYEVEDEDDVIGELTD